MSGRPLCGGLFPKSTACQSFRETSACSAALGIDENLEIPPGENRLKKRKWQMACQFTRAFPGRIYRRILCCRPGGSTAPGYRVNFAPHALVMAEVPSTIKGLWKIARALGVRFSTDRAHPYKGMFFDPGVGPIGLYLPINYFNQVVNPILQLILLAPLFIILFLGGAKLRFPPEIFNLSAVVWVWSCLFYPPGFQLPWIVPGRI